MLRMYKHKYRTITSTLPNVFDNKVNAARAEGAIVYPATFTVVTGPSGTTYAILTKQPIKEDESEDGDKNG